MVRQGVEMVDVPKNTFPQKVMISSTEFHGEMKLGRRGVMAWLTVFRQTLLPAQGFLLQLGIILPVNPIGRF
ncbi:hypothetical protein [Desulfobacca acetoxidans]|uniref:Uncharacterized protein n=1 Tax=Desulfobacca acetoxidans (strain ATCC 700848 / DSM 11109 / ASRB2) TaxID=880072 RepID=F2NHW4_DESAR|nr:hypothetical protein [Desulfobacca acetoxidans]AEB09449.1 hypothetical protein Desac_1597 [Desulfobacca acetoxidans DSM 11109]